MRPLSFMRLVVTSALLMSAAAAPQVASASGPVERLLQVMAHPSDPNVLVVRYGGASEGLLFSKDGGQTFRAMCTAVIDPMLNRISRTGQLYYPPVTMDGAGQLFVKTSDGLWVGDATGCNWKKEPAFEGKWVVGVQMDPKNPREVLSVINTTTGDGAATEAKAELMRRDAAGNWTLVGALKKPAARQRAYAGDLVVTPTPTGIRIYSSIVSSSGAIGSPEKTTVVVSDDGGKTWREGGVLPAAQEFLSLVAGDPSEPKRVLGLISVLDAPDTLLLSEDEGKTFKKYAEIHDFSGIAFGPDGRVYIGDAGDGLTAAEGGVWTAAKLGEKLTNIALGKGEVANVDCISYDPDAKKLRICKMDRFGRMDLAGGRLEELTQIEFVDELVSCRGRDLLKICEDQFNEGAAWCCVGHYPFTAFCGQYNITEQDGRRVSCGLAGREADLAAGRGPAPRDAGVQDAGTSGSDAGSADAGSGERDAGSSTNDAGGKPARTDAGSVDAGKRVDAGSDPVEEEDDKSSSDDEDDRGPRRSDDGGCSVGAGRVDAGGTGAGLLGMVALGLVIGRLCRKRRQRVQT